jgi:hypothetical protein
MIGIVGCGIVGLSVAEFLTRNGAQNVKILSTTRFPAASKAAAANLATKAQVFARDPHYALKLEGKKKYSAWLEMLLRESSFASQLSSLYRSGVGRDHFESKELTEKQWIRIRQDEASTQVRGLPEQKLRRIDDRTIECDDEAWVDAPVLLHLLETVCRQRGVEFFEADACEPESWSEELRSAKALVLCAGAGTVRILESWKSVELPPAFKKSLRWTFGGTLTIRGSGIVWDEGISLLECVGHGEPSKVTFSGFADTLYCSSVSIPCAFPDHPKSVSDPALQSLLFQKETIYRCVRQFFGVEPTDFDCEWRWGHRLGFGHKEWLIEPVPHSLPFLNGPLIVAAGMHKSGYLVAPMLGELVMQKLQGLLHCS